LIFFAMFVVVPIFLVVLLLRGNLSSWFTRHRTSLLLLVGTGELASVVVQLRHGVTGTAQWARIAWLGLSALGCFSVAYKAQLQGRQTQAGTALDP